MKKVRTVCFDCHSKCGIILTVDGDKIVRVEGDPDHPISEGMLCTKAFSAQEIHASKDRLTHPLKRVGERGEGKWQRVTWEEALDDIHRKMEETIAKYGRNGVTVTQGTGRGSNHFIQRLRETYGGICSIGIGHVCLAPYLIQTAIMWGRQFHPHEAGDYRNAGAIAMWGTNPIRSRQYTGLRLLEAKRKGARIVVVDPVFRDIAARAELWVPVRPGTDSALAFALTNLAFRDHKEQEAYDFLSRWTNAPMLVDADTQMQVREFMLEGANASESVDLSDRKLEGNLWQAQSDMEFEEAYDPTKRYVVWDLNSNGPVVWDAVKEEYSKENVRPALLGEYELEVEDGTKKKFKTALQTYKDYVDGWTPELASQWTWTPVEKIYEMYDILSHPTDGKSTLIAPYLGACMMCTNALNTGRAINTLQLLFNPPIDDVGGIFFNEFWEFQADSRITLSGTNPQYKMPGWDTHPMIAHIYQAHAHPGSAWDAIIRGDDEYGPRVVISMASDATGGFEEPQKVVKALLSDHVEMIVSMDYFMNPEGEIADYVLPAAHWSERVGNIDEELYPDPCPFVVPQIAVPAPGEAKDDWYFLRELGKRHDASLWPWESSEEMQLWRLRTFHGAEVKDYAEAAEKGYYIEFAEDKRIYRKHEKGLVKFATPSSRVEVYSETMHMLGYEAPYPTYLDPYESPYTQPEVFEEYNLVLTTGARDYAFYHTAWTNIARQRILEPWPYIELNYYDARERQIGEGDWLWVESPRGRIKAKARVSQGVNKGCASMCRPNYKLGCDELNLPGYSWDRANPNVLIPSTEGNDLGWGCAPMRATLCKVTKFVR